jgi:hypothetical protein
MDNEHRTMRQIRSLGTISARVLQGQARVAEIAPLQRAPTVVGRVLAADENRRTVRLRRFTLPGSLGAYSHALDSTRPPYEYDIKRNWRIPTSPLRYAASKTE